MAQLKYLGLADTLRRGIRDGAWPPGARLPAEARLAAEHGVSVNTVRRAFEELVAEGSVERRQGAGTFVRALPPAPRPAARRRVAVVLPESNWYFPPVVQGIEAAAARTRTDVLVHISHYGPRGWAYLDEFAAGLGAVDGLLLTHPGPEQTATPEQARWIGRLGVPCVLVERTPAGVADPSEHVSTDHAGGVYLALEHLASLGHGRVALACRTGSPPSPAIGRGFDEGVAALGLQAVARVAWPLRRRTRGDGHLAVLAAEADHALRTVLDSGATAVVCFGDREAELLLDAAARAGTAVPGDLALVSCEDLGRWDRPVRLTSVAPEKFRLGRLALETLLRRLDEPDAELRRVWLRPCLIVRDTCGAGAAGPS